MNKFIKGLTLICFVIMISGFVAYRSGAFGLTQNDLTNNPITDNFQIDSPPAKKKVIMHSSKSGRILEPSANTNPNDKSDSLFRNETMHSSKSGEIISPNDFKEDKAIMGSSKSMILIAPKKDTAKKTESPQQNNPAQNAAPSKNKKPNKK